MQAARAGRLDTVRELLSAEALIDAGDDDGRTALTHAVIGGHLDVVQELIAHGADLSTPDTHGGSACILRLKSGRRKAQSSCFSEEQSLMRKTSTATLRSGARSLLPVGPTM